MKKLAVISLLAICCSCATAQKQEDHSTFPVLDSLNIFRDISMQKNKVYPEHLVVVDGITMASEEHLNVCLKDIYANDYTQFGLMDIKRAKALRNGNKVGNGVVLLNLDRRAHRKFSKNHKKFRKRERD